VQKRVSSACAAENSIREIKEDGTVTCEADSGATYTAGDHILISTGNAISVNDGTGSGLNADMLDGNEATAFAASTHSHAHSSLTGLTTGDDHTQYFNLSQNETVAGQPAFNGGTSGATAPFTVDSTFLVTNLNADVLDGYNTGNASGNIPLSNGTVNTNLNADLLDGKHSTDFAPDFSLSSEYHIIVDKDESTDGTAMTSSSTSFCFLVEVDFNGLDQDEDGYCDIYVSGTAWYLEGAHDQTGEDQEVQCAARCISW
jgi:hypothetical protein